MTTFNRQLFGTDGVRGIANSYPMNASMAMKLGQAIAHVFKKAAGLNRIVVGKDTRLSGYVIESALVSGICSMGMDAMLVGPLPSPGIAFIANSMRAHAGVMVSASHNPVEYNGIKFFDQNGFKIPDETESYMEKLIFDDQLDEHCVAPENMGKAYRIDDASGRYIQYLKNTFPDYLSLDGLKIVLDCANGAGYKVAPDVFTELGANLISTAIEPNGVNINVDSGALHPNRMAKLVKDHGADIGIALDGDADRIIMCDEKANVIDGDGILAICANHLFIKGNLAHNTVVGTHMSNMGLEHYLLQKGIHFERTRVGDRYVMERMREKGYNLGGENSGHIIFLHHTTSGDGTLAALRVLSVLCQSKKRLSELNSGFALFPQVIKNIFVMEKKPLDDMSDVRECITDIENKLGTTGRVLVRYSGTENILRVMVEGQQENDIEQYATCIAKLIKAHIGK